MRLKKLIAGASAAVFAASVISLFPSNDSIAVKANGSQYNYGEALQKSMFFYQVQQSGPIADWNEVSWRDDCMVNDYVTGGWFDAGDHLKFTLTNAYSAAVLGWGLLEYQDGVESIGELEEYRNNLAWGLDYLVGCDLGDKIVYMIGDGGFDHVWWGSAEVYMEKYELMRGETERPYYTCNDSCIEGQMAAALAIGYLCFEDSDPEKAEEYLTHAKACFDRANKNRSIGDDEEERSYYSISSFYDDLFFAANWLYRATGDQYYLDLCETDFIPNLQTESQSDELKFTWGYCWDDVQQAGTLLYAQNTGDAEWINQMKKHFEYWTTGYGGKQITYTQDGLAWLFQWGSLRHATTTAFLAYVACDTIFADDPQLVEKYTEFADRQMNYCFGDNGLEYSYVIGMGDSYPHAWHHRTSSGAWNDKWSNIGQVEGDDAKEHAHTLYGALVGGPDQYDGYSDKIGDYQYTEVAIDYNAGYTAALCAMVDKYGGSIDESFPEEEEPKWDEFYIEACINQASQSYTEIKVQTTNHSAWPPRTIKDLSYNYYMDFTELFEAGLTVDDVTAKIGYDEWSGNCTISKPIHYRDNIYYVKISYIDGTKIMPTGQSEHQGEIQFRVSIPDNIQVWNAENDYSYSGLVKQDLTVTDRITLYDGDTLIWGTEP
ncbi:MAG: glycoside hydrolase family 9 protein [Hominimerdicola sp.]